MHKVTSEHALCANNTRSPARSPTSEIKQTRGARLVQVGNRQAARGDVHIEHFDVQQALWRRRLPAIWHDVEGHAVGVHQHAAQHLRTRPLGSMRNCICSECVTHCFSTAHKLKEREGCSVYNWCVWSTYTSILFTTRVPTWCPSAAQAWRNLHEEGCLPELGITFQPNPMLELSSTRLIHTSLRGMEQVLWYNPVS